MKVILAALLAIVFGSLYTVFRKFQGVVELPETDQRFNRPLLQAFFIFLGMLTMICYRKIIPQKQTNDYKQSEQMKKQQTPFIYMLPSALDVAGTVTDTAGLYYTSVSVSQMLKGSVLIFTYILTICKPDTKLSKQKHLHMLLIIFSLFMIGCSNIGLNQKYQQNPIIGNTLIIISQFLFALMFLSQQHLTKNYKVKASNAVMWQGFWGAIICAIAIVFFQQFQGPLNCDFLASCEVISSNYSLLIAMVITGLCIAPFNYFGLVITQKTSALQRCIICTSRMVIVWIFSLALSWQSFSWMQLFGYVLLTIGIQRFNQQITKDSLQETSEEHIPISQDSPIQVSRNQLNNQYAQ